MNKSFETNARSPEERFPSVAGEPLLLSLKDIEHCDAKIHSLEDLSVMDELLSKQDVVRVILIENMDNPTSIFSGTIIHLYRHYDVHDADNQMDDTRRMKKLYLHLTFASNVKGAK